MKILSNLATSIDGKIAPASQEFTPIGTDEDRRRMVALRKQVDCVLFGAATLRAYQRACTTKQHPMGKIWNAVLSSDLSSLSLDWPFFQDDRIHRILFHTSEISPARTEQFSKVATIIKLKTQNLGHEMVAACQNVGVQNLLVEGGGSVMWHFVKENLIDEYYVTLTPKLIGGSKTPTLVDGDGFKASDMLSLHLKSFEKVGDELYLVYSKKGEES